jgi:hypothetical protein
MSALAETMASDLIVFAGLGIDSSAAWLGEWLHSGSCFEKLKTPH